MSALPDMYTRNPRHPRVSAEISGDARVSENQPSSTSNFAQLMTCKTFLKYYTELKLSAMIE